jgi:hypothetical protein
VLLLETRGALGAERASTIFWVVPAPIPRCATGEDFAVELLRRSPHARLGRLEEAALVFRVELFEEHGATRGRLTVRERGGHETVRVVPGVDCREVIIALAVIAAVLVDPGVPSGENSRSESAQPVDSLPAEPKDSQPRATTVRLKPRGWGYGAGAGLLVQAGVSPTARYGAGVEAHIGLEAERVASPLFALGAYYTLPKTVPTPSGEAELNWWTVRASACPFRWPAQASVILRPCALFDLGRLVGHGSDTDNNRRTESGTWVAMGGGARIDVIPVPGLWITVEGGALAPFIHHRFFFAPDSTANTAFETSSVGAFGRFALTGRLM